MGADGGSGVGHLEEKKRKIEVQSRAGAQELHSEVRGRRQRRQGHRRGDRRRRQALHERVHGKLRRQGSPYKGSASIDAVSMRRIDAHTTERTDKKDGKVVQILGAWSPRTARASPPPPRERTRKRGSPLSLPLLALTLCAGAAWTGWSDQAASLRSYLKAYTCPPFGMTRISSAMAMSAPATWETIGVAPFQAGAPVAVSRPTRSFPML